jgi:hypothetical protein
MSDQMEDQAEELLNALEAPALASDARALQTIDAMEDLKREVLGFFKNRIASIARAERIKELMYRQLETDIEGGTLSFDQMMTLLMRLDRDNNDAADSLLRSMTGGNNGPSGGGSIFTDIVRPGSDKTDLARAFDNYTPEELRKINETMKVIRDIVESGTIIFLLPRHRMLYGQIKPIVIKLIKSRFRYRLRSLSVGKPVRVIAFDMKHLLVADSKARVHKVLWKDIELVDSESIIQVPVVQVGGSKIVNRPKEKKPFFKAGTKSRGEAKK